MLFSEIREVRDVIGDGEPPTDAELEDIYGRTGTVGGVIHVVLSRRLADLVADPAQFNVAGEYSQNTAANIQALREQLERYAAYAPGGGAGVVTITRSRPRWRR